MLAGLPISLRANVTLEQQAAAAWANRSDPDQTVHAYNLWYLSKNWTAAAMAAGRMARHALDSNDMRRWAGRMRTAAESAVKENPNSSDAYTVLGEALGEYADAYKGITSLRTVHKAIDALHKAVELDPKNARAHMLLSQFYRQAPSGISVGDKTKAFTEAKLAVQYGPDRAINRLALAQIQIDRGEKDAAIRELKMILAMTPPADAVPETQADQETARTLLQQLGALPSAAAEPATALPLPGATGACSETNPTAGCQPGHP